MWFVNQEKVLILTIPKYSELGLRIPKRKIGIANTIYTNILYSINTQDKRHRLTVDVPFYQVT